MSVTQMTKPTDESALPEPTPAGQAPQFSTLSVHGGELRQKPGDSITDPIFCASTYTFPDTQSVIDYIEEQQPREEYGRYGNPGERVAERKLAALEGAITPNTRLLVSESPTNPHLSIVDLERFADIGRRHGVESLIDATLATPYNLRPIEYGVDYVLHSVTKYLAGHNDLLAGVVVGSTEQLEPIRNLRGIMGAINGPQNAYLLLRGLKTFEL